MKTTNGMKDNLCFDENENKERADEALNITLRKQEFWCFISGCTHGFDVDTGDVLYFFPLLDIKRLKEEDKKRFLDDIKKNWVDANFEILEEKELAGDEYFHVGFRSLFFRLKSLI